ncbi:MAG TPA: sigma-70 family RNA polymerase sigma factor [Bacteroidia bacterium]|nr:sigma-70 family RNA polymerase sigma factor [Bacteroidia bacterium]
MPNQPTYELIRKKDPGAVSVLYERYGRKLAGYAIRKWNTTEDDAWDVTYKTLFRVMETSVNYTFISEEKFSGFVFTVFVNYLRNLFRDRKKLPEFVREMDEKIADQSVKEETSPAVNLLNEALDQLEDWERILLLMRSQDVPYSRIAEITGRPEDNLKVYYGRLKKKLEEMLSEKMNALNKQRT